MRPGLVPGLILIAALAGYWLTYAEPPAGKAAAPHDNEATADKLYVDGSDSKSNGQAGSVGEAANPTHDSVAKEFKPSAKNRFIRALEEFIGLSPWLEKEQDSLQAQLLEADDAYSRAKQEGRTAVRQASRQVRVRDGNSPNIILIVADQLSYDDLGCFGNPSMATPEIDRMAADGCRFTQFYAGSGDAPGSQWSLLTALQSTRTQTADAFSLDSTDVTIAETLWQAGYTTELIGDASLGGILPASDPQLHGFDRWYGFDHRPAVSEYPEYVWTDETRLRIPENAEGKRALRADDLLTREVRRSVQRHRRGRPFFLYFTFASTQPDDLTTTDHTSKVARLDRSVGLIRQTLSDLAMARNTIILLTSESGAPEAVDPDQSEVGRQLRGGSGTLYEGGIRVPLIVSGTARVPSGTIVDQICGAWDLLPTLADLVGAWHRPRNIDGLSLLGSLRGQTEPTHQHLVWAIGGQHPADAVRLGQWKAVRPHSTRELELYDLSVDPRETENIASQRPDVIAEIKQLLVNSGGPK